MHGASVRLAEAPSQFLQTNECERVAAHRLFVELQVRMRVAEDPTEPRGPHFTGFQVVALNGEPDFLQFVTASTTESAFGELALDPVDVIGEFGEPILGGE